MKCLIVYSCLLAAIIFTNANPIAEKEQDESSDTSTENGTIPQDLYVIRSVVYEVGILTDASNDTNNLNETQEEIDFSVFNPDHNGTIIDLSHIPIPIQTNVSGVSVTGLLTANHVNGSHQLDLTSPLLPQKQLTVIQNISTHNPDKGSKIIENLPELFHLNEKKESDEDDSKESNESKKH